MDRPQGWGADLPFENRPGVPREAKGTFNATPPTSQPKPARPITQRMERSELTPVFGTAQPPRGASGYLRRYAYSIPEFKARRWLLLIAADRVDVLEHGLGGKLVLGAFATLMLGRRLLKSRQASRSRVSLRRFVPANPWAH